MSSLISHVFVIPCMYLYIDRVSKSVFLQLSVKFFFKSCARNDFILINIWHTAERIKKKIYLIISRVQDYKNSIIIGSPEKTVRRGGDILEIPDINYTILIVSRQEPHQTVFNLSPNNYNKHY